MSLEIKAVLKQVHQTITNGNFESRKVWLTIDPQGQYPQTIEVEVQQAKINLFNNIAPGTWVTAHINLRGREWTNKENKTMVFNTLSVWKVEVAGKENTGGKALSTQQQTAPAKNNYEEVDEVPF